MQQVGVLADPAQARLLGQRLFQHRCAVGEDTVAEMPHGHLNTVGEFLQPRAHNLVVIAPERVARNVTAVGVFQ